MSLREKFVAKFGEHDAAMIEAAANGHKTGVNGSRLGSDPFRWALVICIGHECVSRDAFREEHDIVTPWEDMRAWIRDEAHLEDHDGDVDYLALMAGAYNEFMPTAAKED